MLKVNNLKVSIEGNRILNGINLEVKSGEIHALMGHNGSGKSTLAQVLMGHPGYKVEEGTDFFENQNLLELEPDQRANLGLFLSFQYPSEISGVNISSYLRMLYNKRHNEKLSPVAFRKVLKEKMELLKMSEDLMNRYLNEGFSGGEKKRMEMLQMLVLEPKLAVLDETDSGLDIDALKIVTKAIEYLHKEKSMSVFLITHYSRVLKYLEPDSVHVMKDGQIVKSGGKDLAHQIEDHGYDYILDSNNGF